MARFFLVRHGQTTWNKDQRFRGRKDIPLSDQGLREARAMADALGGEGVDHVYASPLKRSIQTLTPLAERLGKEVIPFEEVIDMNFGEWEGAKVEDAEKQYPEMFEAWKHRPETVTFPGGESLARVQARAMRGISRLALEHAGRTVAVCSHRVVTKLVMLGLLGVKPDRFWAIRQDTACMNRFEYDPPAAIIFSVNETFHLKALGGTLRQDF